MRRKRGDTGAVWSSQCANRRVTAEGHVSTKEMEGCYLYNKACIVTTTGLPQPTTAWEWSFWIDKKVVSFTWCFIKWLFKEYLEKRCTEQRQFTIYKKAVVPILKQGTVWWGYRALRHSRPVISNLVACQYYIRQIHGHKAVCWSGKSFAFHYV